MGPKDIQIYNLHQKRLLKALKNKDPELVAMAKAVKLDWFKITNADDKDEATLYIYEEIMSGMWAEYFGAVSAQGMIDQLNEITASTINIRINSPGGEVFEAIAIYNALVSHSATINVYVDALAASAASVIAMAGDKLTMMVGAQMMIHDAMGYGMGNAKELRDYAEFLDRQSDNIASIYAARSGAETSDMRDLMLAETWMFADEAVALNFADEVYVKSAAEEGDEEDPDKTDEPDPDDPEEEKETEETTDETEETLDDLINRRHSLVARGFNYAGRKRAPAPPSNGITDDLLDNFIKTLQGK